MMDIPDALGPFLEWLRVHTERTWSTLVDVPFEAYVGGGVGGTRFVRGTRWTGGLTETEIDAVEDHFDLQFCADHRLFLRVLHATEPLMRGAYFIDESRMRPAEEPGFYHWQRDEPSLREAWKHVVEGLVFDVEYNALWRPTWGPRPDDAAARAARVAELVAAAPRLAPIYGHRHVVADGIVLSVHQSDIVVYGANLRDYLLRELTPFASPIAPIETRHIPFWGDLIAANHESP